MDFKICPDCNKDISTEIPFCPYCGAKQKNLSDTDYSKNPFEVLQVSQEAEKEVIEAAYKSLAKKYHPDIDSSEHAQEKMKEINWAFGILRDDNKRDEWKSRNRNTETPPKKQQASHTQESKTNKGKTCPVCKNSYSTLYSECPYCKSKQEREILKSKEVTNKGRVWAITVMILFFLGFIGLPYLFGGNSQTSSMSSLDKTNSFRSTSVRKTSNINKTKTVAYSTNQARTQAASILFPKRTPTKSNINYAPPCLHWSIVGSQHAGKIQCVYGKVMKIMHNDYGNGFYEYVIRFVNSDDQFLVKSENYWFPDLKIGQCWYFKGVIQDNGTYFFMKEVTGRDVEGGLYSGCN